MAQFDALAEATLNSATERNNPKASTQLWAANVDRDVSLAATVCDCLHASIDDD